jgi:hypothetical protein
MATHVKVGCSLINVVVAINDKITVVVVARDEFDNHTFWGGRILGKQEQVAVLQ